MLEIGKNLFKSNLTQTFLLFFCFGIAILAKNFTTGTIDLTLRDFLTISLDNLFTQDSDLRIWLNVVIPFVFYLCAGALLLWMSISNFITFQHEDNKLDISLKLLLALFHGFLSFWFIMLGMKLALYFFSFAFTLFLIIGCLIYFFATRTNN